MLSPAISIRVERQKCHGKPQAGCGDTEWVLYEYSPRALPLHLHARFSIVTKIFFWAYIMQRGCGNRATPIQLLEPGLKEHKFRDSALN
jgi:hypothetical protein